MIEVLSLGAGVQSTTVLLMSIVGELPKLDHAIFADTGWEPKRVYSHLQWLTGVAEAAGVKVHVVTQGNLKADAPVSQVRGKAAEGKRWASLPLFTKKVWVADDIKTLQKLIEHREAEEKDSSQWKEILAELITTGVFVQNGMIRRQCTYEYKIRPIELCLRRTIMGLKPRQRAPKEVVIRQWRGISVDEWQRSRKSDHPWMETWHPLVEKRITRRGCVEWLRSHGYPEAPRSACIGCPFHHDDEWRRMRDNSPEEWQDAIEFDRGIRNCGGMRGQVFLHAQRVPLDEVDLRTDSDHGQLSFWQDECQGMCGV